MSQSDPTDNALAAIARILDQPPVIAREQERYAVEEMPAAAPLLESPSPFEAPPSIEAPPREASPLEARSLEANGYSKVGPGPIAAIRFKWTVREDRSDYYVDESIGEHSTPVIAGPMTRDAAIQLVDDREADARRRFEQLKSEMTGRAAVANLARRDSGEA